MIGSLAYVGSAVGLEPAATAATRYLPADGSAAYERTETTRELDTSSELQVTESAQITGVAGVLSTDTAFGIKIFADLYDESANLRIWRTTSTTINDPAPRNQVTRVYQTNSDIRLLGESTPDTGYAYRPGLVELPADAHAGQSWTSSGSASDALDYSADLRADAGEGGCLMVTGEVRYTTKAGSPFRVVGDRTHLVSRSGPGEVVDDLRRHRGDHDPGHRARPGPGSHRVHGDQLGRPGRVAAPRDGHAVHRSDVRRGPDERQPDHHDPGRHRLRAWSSAPCPASTIWSRPPPRRATSGPRSGGPTCPARFSR